MASIRKRNGKWQAQVRRKGNRAKSKTFATKREALAWTRKIELELESAPETVPDHVVFPFLHELLDRYLREVTPRKRGASVESYRIRKLQRHPIASMRADLVGPSAIAEYRDDRLNSVSGETVRQDIVLLSQVFETARREWQLSLPANPTADVRKPPPARPRARRISDAELHCLLTTAQSLRNPLIVAIIRFALATGMRRGEILRVRWIDIDWHQRTLNIPLTKNGHSRVIPLTQAAVEILQDRRDGHRRTELVFPVSANAFKLAWQRLRHKAGVRDLRFHDFRHEAISRFFEVGLSLPEVALISGHRDPRQLLRYTHMQAAQIAQKLNQSQRDTAE
ncbi:tyrosine-type recombinase/integrase [Nitratireductor aquimarinus]|uniref:site-specific integrase n=1 Tax=Nitratireductor TaxID=245876 RepID=UPI0019D40241|nr:MULTISPECIES: site-specific integrase [Nitratireductor]MBN7775942.1 tyrosine-type recombinase/integrase [Nitratireductor pacificus]MBN7780605.1 tyrosine-type recombinase/integrase [Nitratireductor pacificus]MBN7789412.1 tyrosine-type recombinase/integrase [Nitratireductor aquimarinus]MBY6098690.1 site-specific integrase [Nitratireductor aquimarinus]MCA1259576.1 site-specific integrase [Nitratireductor aquimarinus]